ncbi:MAG: CHASE3 domain-containing protein [Bacteroidota bacterium]
MNGRTNIIGAFGISIITLTLIGLYAYQSATKYKGASDLVHHTQDVITEVQRILTGIQDIESEQRGYVITGKESFLEFYEINLVNLERDYKDAKTLIRDNNKQLALLDSIHFLITQKIQFSTQNIALYKNRGFESAKQSISEGYGENRMREIKRMVSRFIKNEDLLLSERLDKANEHFLTTTRIIIGSISLTILILLITLYFFVVDYDRRVASEKQLKIQQEEIEKLSEFQNVILNGTDYSIIAVSYPEGVITVFNKGAEKMLGYAANEMIGIHTPAIIHKPEEVVARAETLSNEFNLKIEPGMDVFFMKSQRGLSDISEWTYIRKDGSELPVELSITVLKDHDHNIIGYLGLAKDISESKKAKEEIIKAKEKAEQAVHAKSRFLANMSHEIRTPMNAIIGFTELLADSKLDKEQSENLNSVQLAGINLLAIINDILDFSKIESGSIVLENVPFDLKDALKNIYNLMNGKAKEKKLEYNHFLDAGLPDFVTGDSIRLNQILINLIGNAMKFTENGSVTVSVKKLEEDKQSCKIRFTVKDTGIGISEDKISLVFDRFSQANAETTRKFGGTGLGLSIAKNLVELQGGEIKLKSKLNEGSEFSFELVYQKAQKNSSQKKEKLFVHNENVGKVKILLCEDNTLNQQLAKKILTKFGFDFEIAGNGKMGLEKLQREKFDLVLMDLQMPEMDGYQTTIAIREQLNLTIPIIAMTAHSLVGEKDKCLEIGMNDYLGKPFTQEDLYFKISSYLPQKNIDRKAPVQVVEKTETDSDAKIVNLKFLKEFSDGNKIFEKEMIEMFLRQVPVDIDTLGCAFNDSDSLLIKSTSHKLKSSISIVGLSSVEKQLSFIEKNALNKEMEIVESSKEKYTFIKKTLNENYPILRKILEDEY